MQLKTLANKAAFNTRKASPYIFFGIGVLSFGGAIATAIRATMHLETILDEHKEVLASIQEATDDEEQPLYNEKELKTEVRTLYFHTCGKIARLYAPTAALGTLSLGSFTASAGILRGRYLMAAGALESVSEAFDNYRDRVIADLGEDKDLEYYYGVKKEKISVKETDPETGKTKKVKKTLLTGTPDGGYSYRFEKFDGMTGKGSAQWDENHYYNETYIRGILAGYQNNLDAGKIVYLDRVLDDLGFTCDKEYEHLAGWLPGDTIDCGLDNVKMLDVYQFLEGESPDVTLRFNPRTNVFIKQKEELAEIVQFEKIDENAIEGEVVVNE